MNLHGEIMNLQCRVPTDANVNQSLAWKNGHKQARHDACELANAADVEIKRLRDALRRITEVEPDTVTTTYDMRRIARKALTPNAGGNSAGTALSCQSGGAKRNES